jgi:hypothetical protein
MERVSYIPGIKIPKEWVFGFSEDLLSTVMVFNLWVVY